MSPAADVSVTGAGLVALDRDDLPGRPSSIIGAIGVLLVAASRAVHHSEASP